MSNKHRGGRPALCLAITLACIPAMASKAGAQTMLPSFEEFRFNAKAVNREQAADRNGQEVSAPAMPGVRLFHAGKLPAGNSLMIPPGASTPLARSVAAGMTRLIQSTPSARRSTVLVQQASSGNRNWIQRHPVLFGTLVGFGAGFLVGYLPGDDAVFDDFTAEFNGLVIGGIGAGAGALVGWAVSR